MPTHHYAIIDVFADEPLTGNPLAVVTGADDLHDEDMAAIAAEFNLSETTFVSRPSMDGADFRLRSYTSAGNEDLGAGHNALGAWWWLVTTGRAAPPRALQELGGRLLPVLIDIDDDTVFIGLDQGPVDVTEVQVDDQALRDALATRHPVELDPALPPVTGSVGSRHLLVAMASMHDVAAVRPRASALARLLASAGAQGCYVYSTAVQDRPYDAYCRFFNPTVGIVEDPATGSAAGPLAAHLHRLGLAGRHVTLRQGDEAGRPSVLTVTIGSSGTRLTGPCALSASGVLHV